MLNDLDNILTESAFYHLYISKKFFIYMHSNLVAHNYSCSHIIKSLYNISNISVLIVIGSLVFNFTFRLMNFSYFIRLLEKKPLKRILIPNILFTWFLLLFYLVIYLRFFLLWFFCIVILSFLICFQFFCFPISIFGFIFLSTSDYISQF